MTIILCWRGRTVEGDPLGVVPEHPGCAWRVSPQAWGLWGALRGSDDGRARAAVQPWARLTGCSWGQAPFWVNSCQQLDPPCLCVLVLSCGDPEAPLCQLSRHGSRLGLTRPQGHHTGVLLCGCSGNFCSYQPATSALSLERGLSILPLGDARLCPTHIRAWRRCRAGQCHVTGPQTGISGTWLVEVF